MKKSIIDRVRVILFPLTLIYLTIIRIRNHLYDIGNKKSIQFNVFTIGVGNLRVGGTGKTPISLFFLKFLGENQFSPAYLSRGYGRKTNGFKWVESDSIVSDVGDEPNLIKSNFPELPIAVCEERIFGIPEILGAFPKVNVIVLDDIFQHRKIKPHLNILLTAYHDLFIDDFVLPTGNLRESRYGARRADLVIITKTPKDITSTEKNDIILKVIKYCQETTPVIFAYNQYEWKDILSQSEKKNYLSLSAIADNDHFIAEIKNDYKLEKSFTFSDHHQFSENEIKEIITFAKSNSVGTILTTSKDWQRLSVFKELLIQNQLGVKVLELTVSLDNEKFIKEIILEKASLVH